MEKSPTFSILIWINASRAKNNEAAVFARITVNQRRANISLRRKIEISKWDANKSRAKGNGQEARTLNHYLDQVKTELINIYSDLRQSNKLITAQLIKSMYLGTDVKHQSLKNLINYHNLKMESKLHKDTLRHYKTSQKYIMEFVEQEYKTFDIFLGELNYAFIIAFENYLRNHKTEKDKRTIANNTAMKHLQRLRKMVTLAFHLEWIEKDPFVKYKFSNEKREREFLTKDELQEIENFTTDKLRLVLVKDLFVFSCYTGIAYIDVMQLSKDNIVRGIDGENWIITKREKTNTLVKIPVLDQSQVIINKYKNNKRTEISGSLFPKLSNQKINSYLKEIATACKIKKNLTFHMARHTFATTVTLTNGVPIETVSKLLGHTKLATTQIYAKVIERKVSDDMNILRNILKHKNEKEEKNEKCS